MACRSLLALFVFVVFMVTACGTSGDPALVTESYIAAVVAGDETQAINLSCAAWEEQARIDADAFLNVESTIEGLTCSLDLENAGETIVRCSGKIIADYQGENKEFDLSLRPYRVAEEGGEWRVCGYQ